MGGVIVVVATWVVAGTGVGSMRVSGFAVGATVKTVGGVDGSTTMMLGSGAAVAGTVTAGTVMAVTVVVSVAESVLCAKALTALDVSMSFVCSAAT